MSRVAVDPEKLEAFLDPYLKLWMHYRSDLWAWMRDCMRTRDEDAPPGRPKERIPVPDLPHLRVMAWAWYSVKLLEVDKARQMMLTWFLCGGNVHEAMFFDAANIGYQHMTSADSAQKIERYMLYVLTAQPMELMMPWVEERAHPPTPWVELVSAEFGLSMTPKNAPRSDQPPSFGSDAYVIALELCHRYKTMSGPEGVEEVELRPYFSDSPRYIRAIPAGPKGPNKWRGETRTRAGHDEAFFHQSLSDNVSSAAKSVGQNGRQILITTANMGEDGDGYPLQMIERHPTQPAEFGGFGGHPTLRVSDLPEGVDMWRTKMGYTHIRIHHFADPSKRGSAWIEANVMTGDIRKNMREVLVQYDVPTGKPFYETFQYVTQKLPVRKRPEGSRVVLCMDGGRRPATACCLVTPSGRVIVARELVTDPKVSTNVRAHAKALQMILNADPLFDGWQHDHVLILDPSMFDTRGETSNETSANVLVELGFHVLPGSQNADYRYNCLTELNLRSVSDDFGTSPALLVDSTNAPTLYAALSGACCVSKNAERAGANVKEKNHYSHVTDALEYGATYLDGMRDSYARKGTRDFLKVHEMRRR